MTVALEKILLQSGFSSSFAGTLSEGEKKLAGVKTGQKRERRPLTEDRGSGLSKEIVAALTDDEVMKVIVAGLLLVARRSPEVADDAKLAQEVLRHLARRMFQSRSLAARASRRLAAVGAKRAKAKVRTQMR